MSDCAIAQESCVLVLQGVASNGRFLIQEQALELPYPSESAAYWFTDPVPFPCQDDKFGLYPQPSVRTCVACRPPRTADNR
jgi:hypothetical protein